MHTRATAYIFEKRAQAIKRKLTWVNYIGLIVPLLAGAVVLSFDFDSLNAIKIVGGAILLPQIAINLWSIVGGWVDALPYSNISAVANDALSKKFMALASIPPNDLDSLKTAYEKLAVEDEARTAQDALQHVRDSEKRMGMRYALRKFQRKCAGCNEVPRSMSPTDCDVCGKFRYVER